MTAGRLRLAVRSPGWVANPDRQKAFAGPSLSEVLALEGRAPSWPAPCGQ
jgi:hypothetical protein